MRHELIALAHDSGGHPGQDYTIAALDLAGVGWPTRDADVTTYVDACTPCQRIKNRHTTFNVGVTVPTVPERPYDTLYVDTLGPIDGDYVCVIVDGFSKFLWLRAIASTSAASIKSALDAIAAGLRYPRTLRVDSHQAHLSVEMADWAKSHGITIAPSPPHAHHTLGTAETRMDRLRQLAMLRFGDDKGTGAARDALKDQTKLDALADILNARPCRGIGGRTAHEVFRGYMAGTPVSSALETAPFRPGASPLEAGAEAEDFHNRHAATLDLAAIALSVGQFTEAAGRDGKRQPTPAFPRGTLVMLWYPRTDKFQSFWRGPFVSDGESRADAEGSWFNVRQLADHDNADAKLQEVHVSRLREFNASRTSIPELLAHGLHDDFGVVVAITNHHVGPDGNLEFLVTWEDKSQSYAPASWLGRVTLFKQYCASAGITAEQLKARKRAPAPARAAAPASATTDAGLGTAEPASAPSTTTAPTRRKGKGKNATVAFQT